MHEVQFADSVLPSRSRVLHLTMRPYSIGHELILLQRRNAVLFQGFKDLPLPQRVAAVSEAALVCYRTWKQNKKPEKSTRFWECLNRNVDWERECQKFLDYRESGCASPPVCPSENSGGREMGAPFYAALIQFVISKLGKTEEEAFDYPLGLAKTHYYTSAEETGSVKIPNSNEIDFDEYCRSEDAKASAKAKEGKCPAS